MNQLVETLAGSWFALGLVKSTLIGLAGGAFMLCVRQHDLATKLWAGLALILPLALFSGTLPVSWKALPRVEPAIELHFASAVEAGAAEPAADVAMEDLQAQRGEPAAAAMTIRDGAAEPVPAAERAISRDQFLPVVWVAGAIATLLPAVLALLAARRLDRSPPPDGILNLWNQVAGDRADAVPIRISRDLATPGIAAVFRPEILLPQEALGWDRNRLLAVLRHEFHHVRQRDAPLRWLGRVTRSLLWFHPLAWWVQSRLVGAQERAADDAVISSGVPAPEYAGHLLDLVSGRDSFPGIAMARRSQVGRRVRAMLSERNGVSRRRAGVERGAAFAVGTAGILAVIVGFGGPEAARAEAIIDAGFRGPIVDRNGVLLATSNPARMPEEIRSSRPARWYPEGESLGHACGFILRNGKGAGLEASPGLAEGKPLKLTLDARIQRLAAQALADRPLPGAILVMDPDTGDVLAMASSPAFDPNRFVDGIPTEDWRAIIEDKTQPLVNRAAVPVAPGSFAKLLIALAAAKADKADRTMHCGPSVDVGWARLRDWNPERDETLDMTSALSTSCNTYFVPLALELGGAGVASIGEDFGFGPREGTPWSWNAEWPSRDPEKEMSPHDIAMSALGQGRSSLALLDMARVMSAVASGEIRPARFSDDDPATAPKPLAELGIDHRELALIRRGLVDLVHSPRGVGKRARIDGTVVAGITATSQMRKNGHAAIFSGFAPADRPRFVVSAIFFRDAEDFAKEPNFAGGTTASTAAAAVMKTLLDGNY